MTTSVSLKTVNQASSLLAFDDDAITIQLQKADRYPLRSIQKAGRQCDSLGLRNIELSGKWTRLEQLAFYQGYDQPKQPGKLSFAPLNKADEALLQDQLRVMNWAKRQINLSASICTPLFLVEESIRFLKEIAGNSSIHSRYWVGDELLKAGWVGCHAVGKGSIHPPVMAVIEYRPKAKAKQKSKAALVGKGITFDSGGYTIKTAESMSTMRADMGGAATVVAALALSILQGLDVPVSLILCCAHNLVSDRSMLPGDILKYRNGVTVELINMDAEGRLVLADGLIYAGEQDIPLIFDAATLTGACMMALGREYTGVFGFDDTLKASALKAAKSENENLWALPLEYWHQEMMPSAFADTANAFTVQVPAGASLAAAYLSRFVKNPEKGWLHFDLSNAFWSQSNAYFSAGASGATIRTLSRLLLNVA